jgi:hypothetical protein
MYIPPLNSSFSYGRFGMANGASAKTRRFVVVTVIGGRCRGRMENSWSKGGETKQTRRQDDVKWRIQVLEYRQGEEEKKAENNGRSPSLICSQLNISARMGILSLPGRQLSLPRVCHRTPLDPCLAIHHPGNLPSIRPIVPKCMISELCSGYFSPRGAPHRPPSADHGYGGVFAGRGGRLTSEHLQSPISNSPLLVGTRRKPTRAAESNYCP